MIFLWNTDIGRLEVCFLCLTLYSATAGHISEWGTPRCSSGGTLQIAVAPYSWLPLFILYFGSGTVSNLISLRARAKLLSCTVSQEPQHDIDFFQNVFCINIFSFPFQFFLFKYLFILLHILLLLLSFRSCFNITDFFQNLFISKC